MLTLAVGCCLLLLIALLVESRDRRRKAVSERNDARREAREWKAVADALNHSRFDGLTTLRDVTAEAIEAAEDLKEADDSTAHYERLYHDEVRKHHVQTRG